MSLLRDILKENENESAEEKKRPTRKLLTVKDLKVGKQYHLEDEMGEKFKAVVIKINPLESSKDRPDSYEVQYEYADDSYHKKGQTDWFDVTADEQVFSVFESAEEKKHGRRKAGSWGRPKKDLAKQANKATRRLSKQKAKEQMNEEAAAGATAAHSIAGAHGGLGSEPDGSEPSEKLPRARPLWNVKKKKKKKKPMKESLLRQLTLHEEDDPSFDQADVISKLKAAEKSADIDQNTTAFGLEDENGNIVKVFVPTDQAEDFEAALGRELARVGEDDEETDEPVSTAEIAEVLFLLKDQFEIVDVQWGDIPEDEEVEQGMEGSGEGEDLGAEGEGEDLGDEEMDDEMTADDGMGEEEDAKTALTQVIDMMKADSAAKQAEAEADKAKAEAESAKYAAQASAAKVKQEEEILDMEAYNKAQSDADKEAKTLAQLAKYKHDLSSDEVEGEMEDDLGADDMEVDAEVDVDVDVEDEEQTRSFSTDQLMDLLRHRSASN